MPNKTRTNLRGAIMRLMDEYIHNCTNDEMLIDQWLAYAIPDGSTVEDFAENYAEDIQLWKDCVENFHDIVLEDEADEYEDE